MEINKGIVYTNSNCIGCNRCISACPIPGTNISVTRGGKSFVEVDGDKCIHCGQCLHVCKHDAREYRDDAEEFLKDLSVGESISLIVEPSFYLLYPKKAEHILGYLRELGVKKIYNSAYGADIAVWSYLHYMDQHGYKGGISSQCPVIVSYMQKYNPYFLQRLIPLQSPSVCTAIYAHRYLKDENVYAVLGSCIARGDENEYCCEREKIRYNVTYRKLFEILGEKDLSSYVGKADLEENGLGMLCGMTGGLRENLETFLENDEVVMQLEDSVRVFSTMSNDDAILAMEKEFPMVAETHACPYGCVMGAGAKLGTPPFAEIVESYRKNRAAVLNRPGEQPFEKSISKKEHRKRLDALFADLALDDFIREREEKYKQQMDVPEDAYDEIFMSMHKLTDEERNIDCRKCGYLTCKEMAKAIALGYNKKENCIYFSQNENLRLLMTDTMTGIPNDNAFNRFITNLIRNHNCNGYTALFFNIKNFALINERFGFEAGDHAIREFSKTVFAYVNEDEIVVRTSDNNYKAVILNERLSYFLERINRVVLHVNGSNGEEEYPVNVRVGAYELNSEETIPGDVSGKVGMAYTVSKQNENRNIAYYDSKMRKEMLDFMSLGRMLPQALRDREFVVYFQPKVSVATSSMVGAEALVRWKKNGELIPPARFIPIAERNGLITQIDLYVLDRTCCKIREWLDKGLELVKISSNFSKQHFEEEGLAARIQSIVDFWDIPHEFIEVEFTETAYTNEQKRLELTIEQLRDLGFSTSMDDFGTGYSSLSLLQNLNFEVLKLDKSLLGEGIKDVRTQKVILSVIQMAKALDMEVIAEGVETKTELELLQRFKCDLIQGYFFDRPLAEEEFEKRLVDKNYCKNMGENE